MSKTTRAKQEKGASYINFKEDELQGNHEAYQQNGLSEEESSVGYERLIFEE